MQAQFELACIDYRQRACREPGQYWGHTMEATRSAGQPQTPEKPRKRSHPEVDQVAGPPLSPASNRSRDIRLVEGIITQMEVKFTELIAHIHEQESELQTLRRTVK